MIKITYEWNNLLICYVSMVLRLPIFVDLFLQYRMITSLEIILKKTNDLNRKFAREF